MEVSIYIERSSSDEGVRTVKFQNWEGWDMRKDLLTPELAALVGRGFKFFQVPMRMVLYKYIEERFLSRDCLANRIKSGQPVGRGVPRNFGHVMVL